MYERADVTPDDWLEESDERAPESRWGDPERDLPEVPKAPKPSVAESNVDPEFAMLWWRSVFLANVAVAGVSLGPMLVYFRGMWIAGVGATLLGLAALFRTYQHYRSVQSDRERNA